VPFVTSSKPDAPAGAIPGARDAAEPDHGPGPAPARRATLLSQRDGRYYPATVHSWQESVSGLVARVTVREGAALRLAANHVWMSMLSAGQGFAVYSGKARRVSDVHLDLSHLEPLAQEDQRRLSPRVAADEELVVRSTGRRTRHVRAIDLSRGGVRVAPLGDERLQVGERVTVDLRLDGAALVVRGQVTRVDTGSGTAVVAFGRGATEHRVALDRFVLARLGPGPR
jgi:hypothetical protein